MSVDSSGHIINEKGPKNNPREREPYEYQTQFTDPPNFCTHIAWSIYGDVPEGITIDSGSGKISGIIKWFPDQPSCQDNFPYEECEFDGSNWDKDGRFKHLTYDFHFTIQRTVFIKDPKILDCEEDPIVLVESNKVFITEVKCQNLNNLLFIKRYLESSKKSPGIKERTIINVDGVEYTDFKKLEPNHKGPFNCPL